MKKRLRQVLAAAITAAAAVATMVPHADADTYREKSYAGTAAEEVSGGGAVQTAMDFSTKRLIIGTEIPDILDSKNVISSYDGVYLLQYGTEEETADAYSRYCGLRGIDFVDPDAEVSAASGEEPAESVSLSMTDSAAVKNAAATGSTSSTGDPVSVPEASEREEGTLSEGEMTEENNPFSALADETEGLKKTKQKNVIAIIDTGAPKDGNVISAVSLIGENPDDDNGHGTRMLADIVSQNKDAKVISIKALDKAGRGTVSSVYAAMQYAISSGAEIISLSFSGRATEENAALTGIVKTAVDKGITVIGAAGNNGRDAKYYMPGGIEEAVIVGACDKTGARLSASNYGDTVDYYVKASSTSHAAALLAGYVSKAGCINNVNQNVLIYSTDAHGFTPKETEQGVELVVAFYDYEKGVGGLAADIYSSVFPAYLENGMIRSVINPVPDRVDLEQEEKLSVYINQGAGDGSEKKITAECHYDPQTGTVSIPEKYLGEKLTAAVSNTNASEAYREMIPDDQKLEDTPDAFSVASDSGSFYNPDNQGAGSWAEKWGDVTGATYKDACVTDKDLSGLKVGDVYYINDGLANLYSKGASAWGSFNMAEYSNSFGFVFSISDVTTKPNRGGSHVTALEGLGRTGANANVTVYRGAYHGANNAVTVKASSYKWLHGDCVQPGNQASGNPLISPGKLVPDGKGGVRVTSPYSVIRVISRNTSGNITAVKLWVGVFDPESQNFGTYLTVTSAYAAYGGVAVTKADAETAEKLAGAGFTIYYGKDTSGARLRILTTGEDGTASLKNRASGKTVYTGNASSAFYGKDLSPIYDYTYYTGHYSDLKGMKEGEALHHFVAHTLEGKEERQAISTFSIKDYMKNAPAHGLDTGVTGSSKAALAMHYLENGWKQQWYKYGAADIEDALRANDTALPAGTYTIAETKAPDGYDITFEPQTFTIREDGQMITVDAEDKKKPVSIRTTAAAENTGTNIAGPDRMLKIIDKVSYTNLIPGGTYTLKGKLADRKTGEELGVEGAASEITFIPETESGTVDVAFTISAEGFENKSMVVFEYLYFDGTEIAAHAEIGDEGQTIHIPEIRTTACGTDTGTHTAPIGQSVDVTDIVFYKNLVPGREYTVTGTLHLRKEDGSDDGALRDAKGNVVTKSVKFTPENADGPVELHFTVDTSSLRGRSCVVFEDMDYKGTQIAVHADITDEKQTVHFPDIRTTATVESPDGSQVHEAEAAGKMTVIDKVSYKNLTPGDKYTLKGVLMDKSTGKAYVTADGKQVTAEKTLEIAKDGKPDGSTTMAFTLDTSAVAGRSFVVFEYLYTENGTKAASHENINDAGQTVSVIDIGTTAVAKDTGINVTEAQEKATIIDTVSYTGLKPGKKYLVRGTLYDKETGKALDIEGAKAEAEFTPEKADGTVDLTYTISTTALEGKSVVVFEDLYRDGVKIASHADIEDEDQTVHVPKVHTTAYGTDTKTKTARIGGNAQVTDVVYYTNLVPGREYTVTGTLHLKNADGTDGGELKDADGKVVTATQKFTADKADGSVELTFTVDSTALPGKSYVAFEDMGYEGVSIAVHADITDEDQTVNFPDVHTMATTLNDDGEQVAEAQADEETVITDRVFYDNLTTGETYTVSGVLMDRETGKEFLDSEGNKVTAKASFTVTAGKTDEKADDADSTETGAESIKDASDSAARDSADGNADTESGSADSTKEENEENEKNPVPVSTSGDGRSGYIDLTFRVKTSELAGKTFVVFEDLIHKDITVASHADISDEGQTIRIIDLHTNAYGKETEAKDVQNDTEVTITDRVTYTNLIPGREYTVKGHLVDEEGRACVFDGAASEKTFTPDEADGYVDIEFTFEASNLAGSTYVVFEDLYRDGKKVASHADIEDEDQTFGIFSFGTSAADKKSGSKTMTLGTSAVLRDTVTYKGLTPGKTYTLKGVVMDRNSKTSVSGAEKEVTFTPDKADGTTDIEFTLNTSALTGKTLVVFENLYDGEKHIGTHEDYGDEGQTVTVPLPPTATPVPSTQKAVPPAENRSSVKTGDTSDIALFITLMAASGAAVITILIRRRRGRNTR